MTSVDDFDDRFFGLDEDAFGDGGANTRPAGAPLVRAIDSQRKELAAKTSHASSAYPKEGRIHTVVERGGVGGSGGQVPKVWNAVYVPDVDVDEVRVHTTLRVDAWTDPDTGGVNGDDVLFFELIPESGTVTDEGDRLALSQSTLQTEVDKTITQLTFRYTGEGGEWVYLGTHGIGNEIVGTKALDETNSALFSSTNEIEYDAPIGPAGVEDRAQELALNLEITEAAEDIVGDQLLTTIAAVVGQNLSKPSVFHCVSRDVMQRFWGATPRIGTMPSSRQIELRYIDVPRIEPLAVDVEVDIQHKARQTPSRRRALIPSRAADAVYEESAALDLRPDKRRSLDQITAHTPRAQEYVDPPAGFYDLSDPPTYGALWPLGSNATYDTYCITGVAQPEVAAYKVYTIFRAFGDQDLQQPEDLDIEVAVSDASSILALDTYTLGWSDVAKEEERQISNTRFNQRFVSNRPIAFNGVEATILHESFAYREGCWEQSKRRGEVRPVFDLNVQSASPTRGETLDFEFVPTNTIDALGSVNLVAATIVEVYEEGVG